MGKINLLTIILFVLNCTQLVLYLKKSQDNLLLRLPQTAKVEEATTKSNDILSENGWDEKVIQEVPVSPSIDDRDNGEGEDSKSDKTQPSSVAADEEGRKAECELDYWNGKKEKEGTLGNGHYKAIYTTHANLTETFYTGKKVLDIGCGPRGSLEWAVGATAVCVDPLSKDYSKLGASNHKMVYVHTGAEALLFPDQSFDIITSINNLDHVSNVSTALSEVSRVLKDGGTFLLYVDVRPVPTACEPRTFNFGLVQMVESYGFKTDFHRETEHGNKLCATSGTPASWKCQPYNHADKTKRRAFLTLRATRIRHDRLATGER